ncbi:hypothetical protein GQ457_06G001410 [Hibiscus cannabinus]
MLIHFLNLVSLRNIFRLMLCSRKFQKSEIIDIIGLTKVGKKIRDKERQLVLSLGVTHLPQKTHCGLRKVACIGAWHPARVSFTVARAGQNGYHHGTKLNKRVYKLGKAGHESHSAMTEYDRYYPDGRIPALLIKGSCIGPKKRVATLRQSNIKGCPGGDQAQVHRYIFKVRTWSFPDNTGKGQVLWQARGLNTNMFFHEVISSYLCQTHLLTSRYLKENSFTYHYKYHNLWYPTSATNPGVNYQINEFSKTKRANRLPFQPG